MAISQIEKVLLALHKDEREEFLSRLQEEGILHITEIKEKGRASKGENIELSTKIASLERVINYLRPYTKESFVDSLFGNKRVVDENLYRETLASSKYEKVVVEVKELERKRAELQREKTQCETQLEELIPWGSLNIPIEELRKFKQVFVEAGFVPKPSPNFDEKVAQLPVEVEIIRRERDGIYCIFAYRVEGKDEIRNFLTGIGFEPARLDGFTGKPQDIVKGLLNRLKEIEKQKEKIVKRSAEIASDIERIFVIYDENYNASLRERALSNAFLTPRAVCIEGWVRKKDKKRLKRLVDEFATVTLEEIEPRAGELSPVELENSPPVRPFEILTKLYGTPHSREIDPSPLIAPFFILSFALCLADAMYGLVFAFICLIFMRKIKGDKRLLKILTVGSVATIVVGALLGGWFGDLPQRLSATLPGLVAFRERALIFDPMNEPLKFFVLALGVGIVQILVGFFVGFIKLLRQGRILEAVASKLSWDIFWISLFLFMGASFIPLLEGFKPAFLSLITAAALLVLLASGVPSRNFFTQIAKGLFNLYQGIMGTIGDIISYSRLMALGLVTVGLAMAINILVNVMGEIPVMKFVLVPLVFIFGHLFSIGINVLGAYVHTLRLQYAEFFTKFFDGGGEPFSPLRRETRFVMVEGETMK
jgi:V/A-type H+-transporting ATPase subunit I